MFSTLPKTFQLFSHMYFAFNLDQSKKLLFGKELIVFHQLDKSEIQLHDKEATSSHTIEILLMKLKKQMEDDIWNNASCNLSVKEGKHCGKRKKCCLATFYHFSTMFFFFFFFFSNPLTNGKI